MRAAALTRDAAPLRVLVVFVVINQRRVPRSVQSRTMRRLGIALVLLLTIVPLRAQHQAGALTPQIEAVLKSIKATDKGELAVSEEDGRFLRVMVATRGAKSVLEIGGASGYSAIWLGLGARETGGRVVSIEYDPQRAKEESANVGKAGLTDVVRAVHGDAFAEIPKLQGTFDLVFLDAWKPDYKKFFDLVFPRLSPGGVFLAHNVINKKREMEPFLATILTHPSLFTTIVSPGSEGMSVSYKLR
jgi:predicted O-methyltransferase YrrM